MLAERHVELAAAVEAAEAVVAGPIQVVEEAGRFLRVGLTGAQQRVEAIAMLVEEVLVPLHRDRDAQAALEPAVEVDQMLIGVVQQRALRPQSQRDGQTAAERLDQPATARAAPTAIASAGAASACRRPI